MHFYRKDSFITHRAFCDALMEENSRMNVLPVGPNMANLGFRNDLLMMNGGGGGGGNGGGGVDAQFQGVFGGGLENNLDVNGGKPRLPIWLDHNANNPHLENPNNSTFLGPSSSNYNNSGMLPPEMVNWLSRYNGMPQGLSLKEEDENQKEMQLNSMYNFGGSTPQNNLMCSSLPPQPPTPVVNMSATALLQKAAQMGSTRSSNAGGSGGNDTAFGLMSTTLSNLSSPRNGDRLMMMGAATTEGPTQSKGNGGNEFGDGDLTRDFLGVARNERGLSFSLQQELSNFASSTMGFNQFNRNHE